MSSLNVPSSFILNVQSTSSNTGCVPHGLHFTKTVALSFGCNLHLAPLSPRVLYCMIESGTNFGNRNRCVTTGTYCVFLKLNCSLWTLDRFDYEHYEHQ